MTDVAPQPGTNAVDPDQDQDNDYSAQTDTDQDYNLDKALKGLNLAESIRKHDAKKGTTLLKEIGEQVVEDFDTDDASRDEWMKRNKEWMRLATQFSEKKVFPWDGAANVKYPLLTTAALQFASRAYPSLVPSFDIVKAKVIGPDPDGSLTEAANVLSTHMSYQLLYEMDGWEDDLDTLCFVLPIVGVMFRKTYYSEIEKKNVSELVHAKDFVVNYYTKTLKKAPRYTHVMYLTPNEIVERQNYKQFLKYDEAFGPGKGDDITYSENKTLGQEPDEDEDTPRKILEQYRWLDLDEDDYKEPYIVTVDYDTRQVLRITPNFTTKGVTRGDNGEIICITPSEWFTKFGFIPNPDGGFYDLGFGLLLGGINEAVNTLTNQLLDSGTLNNLNAGFIAKGLRIGGKELKFKAGEWKVVNAIGDDLRKNIVPLPSNPPSTVLFQLLGTLTTAGRELASVAEIFTGKLPGQNTPASTTMASIEQGLKVFTSIYKRIYRSLQQEFRKLYELNKLYMPNDKVVKFVAQTDGQQQNLQISKFDYQESNVHIIPAADPNMVSETQKLLKIQGLQEFVQYGHINTEVMTRQALSYQGQDDIKDLMNTGQPPPPLEIQIQQMKSADLEKDRQLKAMEVQANIVVARSQAVLNLAKARQADNQENIMMLEAELEKLEHAAEMHAKMMELMFDKQKHEQEMQQRADEHSMDMQVKQATGAQEIAHNEQKNQKNLEMMDAKKKMMAKSKPKETTK